MNLLATEAFITVVRLGSLQRAADRLGVSAATISRRLTELETQLGVRLVERTTRSLRVTDVGRVYCDQCTRALDALAEASGLVASNETHVAGAVRISAARNLGPLLLDAIAAVQRAHPGVHVVLVETERLLDKHNDDIDLFVRVGAASDDRLVARLLGRYPHVLVASQDYLAKAGIPTRPEDLEQHRIIAFNSRRRFAGIDLVPTRGGASVHVNVQPSLSCNDYETITHAVRDGMGITELPAILCRQRGGLVRVLPQWILGEVTLNLLFAADRLLPRSVRVVIDAIAATVSEHIRVVRAEL